MSTPSGGPVLVLTALDLEYQAVRAHLGGLSVQSHPAGTLFETGELPSARGRIMLAVMGEGNSGAAVIAERAIALAGPRALLITGVAGALKDDLGLGDVVVATRVYAYHGGKDGDDGFLARPRAWDAPHELEQLARYIARAKAWARYLAPGFPAGLPVVHFKPIAAGEVVLNSRGTPLAEQLHRTYNDAVAIEMESAGIAQAGHLNRRLPVLTIRAISDKADGAKHAADEAGAQITAATNAAAFTLALAAEIMTPGIGLPGSPSAQQGGGRDPVASVDGGIAFGGGNHGIVSTGDHATNTVYLR